MTGKSELSALGAPLSSNWGSLASASKIQPCQQPSKAAISGSRPPVSGECRLISITADHDVLAHGPATGEA
ncbi:MAG: hypothetical protein FD172_3522 [Methylocystaceae bacterium]|nr:MAG: hypothetical protein FD172_3522 [Methylocystaceae bacterium]